MWLGPRFSAVMINIFVGRRPRLSCGKSRKVYIPIAVNAVPSRSSRHFCGFLPFSAVVEAQGTAAWTARAGSDTTKLQSSAGWSRLPSLAAIFCAFCSPRHGHSRVPEDAGCDCGNYHRRQFAGETKAPAQSSSAPSQSRAARRRAVSNVNSRLDRSRARPPAAKRPNARKNTELQSSATVRISNLSTGIRPFFGLLPDRHISGKTSYKRPVASLSSVEFLYRLEHEGNRQIPSLLFRFIFISPFLPFIPFPLSFIPIPIFPPFRPTFFLSIPSRFPSSSLIFAPQIQLGVLVEIFEMTTSRETYDW